MSWSAAEHAALDALLAMPPDELQAAIAALPADERCQVEADLRELERRREYNRIEYYAPFLPQRDFHGAGARYRERLFMAGNQLGKTTSGGAEAVYHLTGRYPAWWTGRRFDRPTVGYVGADTGELCRDGPQRVLFGRPDELGTGLVPGDAIGDKAAARGTSDLFDYVKVLHVSGGWSQVKFKTYASGRKAWASDTIDWAWFDEEPPLEVYSEGMVRTNEVLGPVWLTFTPLLGMSLVVCRFVSDADRETRSLTQMGIADRPDYTPEKIAAILAQYPEHEREARANGTPMLGSGAIFPVSEKLISVPPFAIPAHWPRIGAMDFGWDHPFAAVDVAWDQAADVAYVSRAYRASHATPATHVDAIKPWGADLRWAWPHDGHGTEKGSGVELAKQYETRGLKMLHEHAQFEEGGYHVEPGITMMLGRMETGKLKVFENLNDWFAEYRTYHRKNGKIVKTSDDLLSATRYGLMMLRYARVPGRRVTTAIADTAWNPLS